MNQAEEDLLVLAAQNGNQQAFALIYQHYQKLLLRFAFKICNDKELAQDAVQEAWIKSASSLRRLDDPRVFKSWLYRMVRWKTTDLVRQKSQQQARVEEYQDERYEQQLSDVVDTSEELTAAINRLPTLEKQMIHLFYLDELKISEIAVVLDIPVGTVKSRLNRARQMLRHKFEL